MVSPLLLIASLAPAILGCPDHTARERGPLSKRQEAGSTKPSFTSTNPSYVRGDWSYDASENWGAIKPEYATCQTGTQQSPINLSSRDGSSKIFRPTLQNYDGNVSGEWSNWGYGPEFTLDRPSGDYTGLPSMSFGNQTGYLIGWHTHAPAEHTVDGDRSRAELHLVHANAQGTPIAVLGVRMDPGNSNNAFLSQLPQYVPFLIGQQPENTAEVIEDVELNMGLALDSVGRFRDFFTYKGSLTTPPCTEGKRWFVAREIATTSVDQMRALLGASTYSARVLQKLWLHAVNSD